MARETLERNGITDDQETGICFFYVCTNSTYRMPRQTKKKETPLLTGQSLLYFFTERNGGKSKERNFTVFGFSNGRVIHEQYNNLLALLTPQFEPTYKSKMEYIFDRILANQETSVKLDCMLGQFTFTTC